MSSSYLRRTGPVRALQALALLTKLKRLIEEKIDHNKEENKQRAGCFLALRSTAFDRHLLDAYGPKLKFPEGKSGMF
jgi:hypothetical protein